MSLRHKSSTYYEGNNEYKGLGIIKYCALCGTHRPIQGGSVRVMFGGRHFCCADHPRIKDIKCQPPKKKTRNIASIVPVPVKADMKALAAGVVVDLVPSAMSAMTMIILNQTNKKTRK